MGLMDKLQKMMGMPDDEFYDEYDEEMDDIVEEAAPIQNSNSYQEQEDLSFLDNSPKRNKVVNIHATTQLQVVLVKPEHFEDASTIADHLNAKRTVVLNLESASKEISRRLIDFLSGVAYANEGQIKKVANCTYIITPYNVGIMGEDLLDELSNSGLY
ncbi:MAG: cell division protein SepF [Oscillospiraceae bacterium]|nr:cell division protein SepF [Oscillospiraceae bacterium]